MPQSGAFRRDSEPLVSALLELELRRQRQQQRVTEVLAQAEAEQRRSGCSGASLKCVTSSGCALLTELQEVERQISDLRLDTVLLSHDHLEVESRPSSGFYELSDVSLSNSFNSVFSDCSVPDGEGRRAIADDLISFLDCGPGDNSSAVIRRSLSAPSPAPHTPVLDLFSNGDMIRHQSPLHATVQNSHHLSGSGGAESSSTSPVLQSAHWPLPLPPPFSSSAPALCQKRLDTYIYNLLQRRAPPTRSTRPRTSISTEASKSVLRQVSLCVRALPCPSKHIVPAAKVLQQQLSVEEKQNGCHGVSSCGSAPLHSGFPANENQKRSRTPLPRCTVSTTPSPKGDPSLHQKRQPRFSPLQTPLKSSPIFHSHPGNAPEHLQIESGTWTEPEQRHKKTRGGTGSGKSHRGNSKCGAAQRQKVKHPHGSRKIVKSATARKRSDTCDHSECGLSSTSKKHQRLDHRGSTHTERAASSSRLKHPLVAVPEGHVLDRHTALTRSRMSTDHQHRRHHHHRRHMHEQVATVTKHKRDHQQQLRVNVDVVSAQQRQKHKSGSNQLISPYADITGNDSAESASLLHSTIADSSEDEASNFSTNRFADGETSLDDSASNSETEESAGGGAGVRIKKSRSRGTGARAAGQEVASTQRKSFVKVKASRNLKKKILRYRSGSFKLMTTM